MSTTVTIRFWRGTFERIEAIRQQTGLTFIRQIDALTHGWTQLDDAQAMRAICQAPSRPGVDAEPRGVWRLTYERMRTMFEPRKISPVAFLEVLAEAWEHELNDGQRAAAIAATAETVRQLRGDDDSDAVREPGDEAPNTPPARKAG